MHQVQYLSRSLRDFLLGALGPFHVDPSRGHALLARVSVPNARSAKAHAYNTRYALMHTLMAAVAAQGPGSNARDLSENNLQAQAHAKGGVISAQVDGSGAHEDMLGIMLDVGFWQRAYAAGVCVRVCVCVCVCVRVCVRAG